MHSLALMRLVSSRSFGSHFLSKLLVLFVSQRIDPATFPRSPRTFCQISAPSTPFAYRLSFFRILIFQACVFPMLLLRLVREFFLHPLFSFFQMFRLTLYFSSFLLRVLIFALYLFLRILLGLSSELLLLPLF